MKLKRQVNFFNFEKKAKKYFFNLLVDAQSSISQNQMISVSTMIPDNRLI